MVRLEVRKAGPVGEASIELGDVTILAGPPNTGKSYVLRSAFAAFSPFDPWGFRELRRQVKTRYAEAIERQLGGLAASLAEPPGGVAAEVSRTIRIGVGLRDALPEVDVFVRRVVGSGAEVAVNGVSLREVLHRAVGREWSAAKTLHLSDLWPVVPASRGFEVAPVKIRAEARGGELKIDVSLRLRPVAAAEAGDLYRAGETLRRLLSDRLAGFVADRIARQMRVELESLSPIRDVVFVPHGWGVFVYRLELEKSVPAGFPPVYLSYFRRALEGRTKVTKWLEGGPAYGEGLGRVLEISEALLGGRLGFDRFRGVALYEAWGAPPVEVYRASATAVEAVGLLYAAAAAGERPLLIVEEPRMHLSAEVALSLYFAALAKSGYRVVLSTHSETVLKILAALAKYQPTPEETAPLLQEAMPEAPREALARLAEAASGPLDLKIYEFAKSERGVEVREREPGDVLSEGLPGRITDIHYSTTDWAINLHFWKRGQYTV